MTGFPSWPASLAAILKYLKKEIRQNVVETPMQKGRPKRRATSTEYPVYAGLVPMDGPTKEELDRFTAEVFGSSPFVVALPPGTEPAVAVFHQPPIDRKKSFVVGRPASERHEVEIVIRPLPHDPGGRLVSIR